MIEIEESYEFKNKLTKTDNILFVSVAILEFFKKLKKF